MSNNPSSKIDSWQPYHLDHYAQELVLKYRNSENVLNESHKMRMAVAYGLERFWGEHLRLKRDTKNHEKGDYWQDVWQTLQKILESGNIILPHDPIPLNDDKKATEKIKEMSKKIWKMTIEDRRVALMVLTQLCEALVWWTQRYKIPKLTNKGD
ncbi:hypothetical protein [Crocosphaera sp. XPORK-15E]|uniref:hypothetical protein n=1 Tax=Crocosphaera sp. XPORK-15E TaxID=3110247 RepID=UPI002B21EF48|nr:hypothetical protein [Crocosphaera sp. XPORK-15E]MEA5537044.1 hypothetical protein [Crocosphaera sp. XPORK-15E]